MSEIFAWVSGADGERHPVRQDNAHLFRHLGKFAMYDHLYVVIDEDRGAYVWRHHETFKEMAKLALKNKCIAHLNIPEASSVDVEAYVLHATAGIEDELNGGVPEGWE